MVSPVRIRVPPLLKVLQMTGKIAIVAMDAGFADDSLTTTR
jgi:hypothetical protein